MNGTGLPDGCAPKPDKIYVHIAAKLIPCSDRTLRRYIANSILSAEREGKRRWLVLRAEVERLRRERGLAW
jgi:hypothetical protein